MLRTKTLVMLVAGSLALPALVGCAAKASFQAGGGEAQPPPPPPPPPAPAPAPEPAPTTTAATPTPTPPPAETKPAETKPAEPVKSDAKVSGDKVAIPGKIEFDTGLATMKNAEETNKAIDQVKAFLDANPRITKLRIEGHTDNAGNADSNVELSGQRALAVKAAVVAKGAAKERMIAVGCGQTKPIADNSTEDGKAKNRRTEFRIAEVGGKKYMGRDPSGGCKAFGE